MTDSDPGGTPLRILQLTPGTGHFYCGACLRDNDLVHALQAQGHDVLIAPLYLPFHLEEGDGSEPVHLGGINVYLHEKAPWLAKHAPEALHRLLDTPGLLRFASRHGDMTDASSLGEMTVSMLEGDEGRQADEIEKLVDWCRSLPPFDVVSLSNMMLIGMAGRLRSALGRPILCSLQGEAPFLDELPEPHRTQAWSILARRAADVDAFVGVSRWYGELLRERLGFPAERLHVVPNGIRLDGFEAARPTARTVGFLSRLCADKGLPTLVDAFVELRRRPGLEDVRLTAVGVRLKPDERLIDEQRAKLAAAGLADAFEVHHDVSREEKLRLLRTFSVLSVPATYGESFGLYLLEAMATGVPVVQPRHASFPEVLAATGGGLLCEPDDAVSLADGLERLLRDERLARELGERGRAAVHAGFTAERMARDVASVCRMIARAEVPATR